MRAPILRSSRFALPGAALLALGLGCSGDSHHDAEPYTLTHAVRLADLDGDGRLDVVSANGIHGDRVPRQGFATVRLQGATAGSFLDPLRVDTGYDPADLALGDVDGDGRPDAVVANHDNPSAGGGTLATHLQSTTTAGQLLAPSSLALPTRPLAAALADLDGDGHLDLAVVAQGAQAVLVSFWRAGAFATPVQLPLSAPPTSLAAGDLNGDGRVDLVATTTTDQVAVLLQDTTPGSFLAAVDYGAGAGPAAVCIADLNGDGRPDLATANADSALQGLSVLFQSGTVAGTFGTAVSYDTGDDVPVALAAGDLDGDGRVDLVVANYGLPGWTGSVSVLLHDPARAGTLLKAERYRGYWGPCAVAIGDLDGDGKPDLALADGGTLVRFQDPSRAGFFLPPVRLRQ